MISANEKLKFKSDKVFVEAEPPSDRSRPLEWRRSLNTLEINATSLVIKEHHKVNEYDFFSTSMLSSGLKPANENNDPEYEKELIKPKTDLRTIISSKVNLYKIRDSLFRTVVEDRDNKIYSVSRATGYLDLSIADDEPLNEAGGIFAKGAQNGFAWIEEDGEILTIRVSIGKEILKHLVYEIKSGRVSEIQLSIAIDSFSYEVDDALREPHYPRDLLIHGLMTPAAILNFAIVSNEFLQKNGSTTIAKKLDIDEDVEVEHNFEPKNQTQINNIIDPDFLNSIKQALWLIAIVLIMIGVFKR